MNLDIAEDSILPSSTERPALVWQTMGEYPEASSIENKFAQQVSVLTLYQEGCILPNYRCQNSVRSVGRLCDNGTNERQLKG